MCSFFGNSDKGFGSEKDLRLGSVNIWDKINIGKFQVALIGAFSGSSDGSLPFSCKRRQEDKRVKQGMSIPSTDSWSGCMDSLLQFLRIINAVMVQIRIPSFNPYMRGLEEIK